MVADDTPAVNEAVSAAARARGIPVNVMDDVPLSSFIMPAIVDRAPVTIAISTGGAAPLLAGLLRRWLEDALPQRLGGLAALAGRFRGLVKTWLSNPHERRHFWQAVLTGETAERALVGDDVAAEAALRRELGERRAAFTRGDEAA
jgi:uroporphyrin-III C-methyltransferase / precorrin-2 dehydrogenase / sirohydrochlorin ferrochelatase